MAIAGCGCAVFVAAIALAVVLWLRAERRRSYEALIAHGIEAEQRRAAEAAATEQARAAQPRTKVDAALAAQPLAAITVPEGVAAIVLVDTSGSMKDSVRDADGKKRAKLAIARRSVVELFERAQSAAAQQPERPLLLGLYEFSVRRRQPSCRPLLALSAPDVEAARRALVALEAQGDTPIGDALVAARAELAASGFGHQHVLVVTDGQNTKGFEPADVVDAFARLPDVQRPATYLIAFDVEASVFDALEQAGALVLPAAGGAELQQTLDYVLTGKILAEQPEAPVLR